MALKLGEATGSIGLTPTVVGGPIRRDGEAIAAVGLAPTAASPVVHTGEAIAPIGLEPTTLLIAVTVHFGEALANIKLETGVEAETSHLHLGEALAAIALSTSVTLKLHILGVAIASLLLAPEVDGEKDEPVISQSFTIQGNILYDNLRN